MRVKLEADVGRAATIDVWDRIDEPDKQGSVAVRGDDEVEVLAVAQGLGEECDETREIEADDGVAAAEPVLLPGPDGEARDEPQREPPEH